MHLSRYFLPVIADAPRRTQPALETMTSGAGQ